MKCDTCEELFTLPDGMIEHRFNLRPKFTVSLILLTDVTQKEIDRLVGAIKTYNFSHEKEVAAL